MRGKIELLIIVLVILLAAFLRLFQLNQTPLQLFGDEVDVGYQAFSILKTGKDYTGHFLPSYISSFSEPRASFYIYSSIPFVAIFGLNELGVRSTAAFFGILNVLLIYLLVRKLSANNVLAIFTALVLSITPWHLQFSRISYEVTLLITLLLSAAIFFLEGLKNNKLLLISACLLSLTFYTYSTAILFSPLLLILLAIIFRKQLFEVDKKWIISSLFVGFLILSPFLKDTVTGQTSDRFSRISIFSDQKIIDSIITKRTNGNFERFFHNKPITFGKVFVANYLTAFSPQFLFLSGDPNPRHSVRETGELYLAFLPFLLFGLYSSVKNFHDKKNFLFLGWLVLVPIPSALTQEGGTHATRLFLMLPPLSYFIAVGVYQMLLVRKVVVRNFLVSLSFLFLACNFISYLHQYYIHYSQESWRYWQYGYKESMKYLVENQNSYEQILINNKHDPSLVRFLFWGNVDPFYVHKEFITDNPQPQILKSFDGFRVGKFYFGYPSSDINLVLDSTRLYLAFQGDEIPGDWDWRKNPPPSVKVLKVITEPFSDKPYIYLLTGKSS
jgi:4-amino-4-deoxy-L-arabinose transferase-like glycosyltransferase